MLRGIRSTFEPLDRYKYVDSSIRHVLIMLHVNYRNDGEVRRLCGTDRVCCLG